MAVFFAGSFGFGFSWFGGASIADFPELSATTSAIVFGAPFGANQPTFFGSHSIDSESNVIDGLTTRIVERTSDGELVFSAGGGNVPVGMRGHWSVNVTAGRKSRTAFLTESGSLQSHKSRLVRPDLAYHRTLPTIYSRA